jgi:protein TonB
VQPLQERGRLRVPGLALGRGAAVSAALHLLGLGALLIGAPRGGGGSETEEATVPEVVAVDTIAEAPVVGPPASAAAPAQAARRSSGEVPRKAEVGGSRPRRVRAVRPAAVAGDAGGGGTAKETSAPSPPVEAEKGKAGPASARALFIATLRQRMRSSWRPNEVYARIDPQERLPGSVLSSSLMVRLTAGGKVDHAEVAESSGIPALDAEAQDAMSRMTGLPPLPAEMLDAGGGFTVRCTFSIDAGSYKFGNALHRAIAGQWHPSRAFLSQVDRERVTMVQLELSAQGVITRASLVSSAGIGFLDQSALAALPAGLRLAQPPEAFVHRPRPLIVEFQHHLGDLRVRRPQEDMEADE